MANRMGYNAKEKIGGYLGLNDAVLTGMLVGFSTRALVQPFDVFKIRFQLQVESKIDAKYQSMGGMLRTMMREEGVQSFWKGHMAAQYLSVWYSAIQYGSNEVLTKKVIDMLSPAQLDDLKVMVLVKCCCGATSALLATVFSYPFDTIRTRQIAQMSPKSAGLASPAPSYVYSSTTGAMRHLVANEGFSGLFKGLGPQLISMGPSAAFTFGFYELFTQCLYKARVNIVQADYDGHEYLGGYAKCLSSTLAGVLAKALTYPLDTMRKRLQVQGFEWGRKGMGSTHHYTGMNDCFVKIYRQEGLRGFFKGMVPGTLKAGLSTTLYFQLFELFKLWLATTRHTQP